MVFCSVQTPPTLSRTISYGPASLLFHPFLCFPTSSLFNCPAQACLDSPSHPLSLSDSSFNDSDLGNKFLHSRCLNHHPILFSSLFILSVTERGLLQDVEELKCWYCGSLGWIRVMVGPPVPWNDSGLCPLSFEVIWDFENHDSN